MFGQAQTLVHDYFNVTLLQIDQDKSITASTLLHTDDKEM